VANDVVFRLLAETEKARREIEAFRKTTEKEIGRSQKSLDSITKQTSGVALAFASLAGNLGAAAITRGLSTISGAVQSFGLEAFRAGQLFEDLQTKLVTLTGNTAEANKLFAELKAFSAGTPFQLPDLTTAASTLLAFGVATDDVTESLSRVAEVSAASGKPVNDLAVIFGQVRAAGKLTGERLNQLAESQVNIAPAIAKTLNITESEVRDFVSKGKVSFEEFEQAFISLSQEGGIAFNGLVRASLTFSGATSTLGDNLTIFQGTIGQIFTSSEEVKGSLAGFSAVFQELTRIVDENKAGIQEFIANAAGRLPELFGFVGDSIIFVNDVLANFEKFSNIAGAAFFGFAALVVENVRTILSGASALAGAFNIELPGLDGAIKGLEEFRDAAAGTAEANINELEKISESQRSFEETVTQVTDRTTMAFVTATEEFKKAASEQAEADSQLLEKRKENAAEAVAIDQNRLNQARQLAEGLGSVELLEARFEKENELLRFALEQELITRAEFAELRVQQATDQASKLAAVELQFDSQLEAAKDANAILAINREKAIIDARLKEAARGSIEEQKLLKRREQLDIQSARARLNIAGAFFGNLQTLAQGENKQLFEVAKAANTANAIINTALAVTSALATPPFPLGLALASVAAVQGAVQIKTIQAQKFQQGITEIPRGFENDTLPAFLSTGERVVDADTNTDLKAFLASVGSASGETESQTSNEVVTILDEILGELQGQSTEIVVSIGNNEIIREVRDGLRAGGTLAV
jgi:tape measure domain-containing protein